RASDTRYVLTRALIQVLNSLNEVVGLLANAREHAAQATVRLWRGLSFSDARAFSERVIGIQHALSVAHQPLHISRAHPLAATTQRCATAAHVEQLLPPRVFLDLVDVEVMPRRADDGRVAVGRLLTDLRPIDVLF